MISNEFFKSFSEFWVFHSFLSIPYKFFLRFYIRFIHINSILIIKRENLKLSESSRV